MNHRPLFFLLALLLLPALSFAADSERPDLARLFTERGLDGCFVVQRGADTIRVNPERAAMRFRPGGTFSLLGMLVAFDGGVTTRDWELRIKQELGDFVPLGNPVALFERAMRLGDEWLPSELVRLNGRERLESAVQAVGFGNANAAASGEFWRDGALCISAEEQVAWLNRVAKGETPFSAELLGKVFLKASLHVERSKSCGVSGSWILHAEEAFLLKEWGGAPEVRSRAGDMYWQVGMLERNGETLYYAMNLSPRKDETRSLAVLAADANTVLLALMTGLGLDSF